MSNSRGQNQIEDYGFLSDCRSAALVHRDGSVDWWCPGRFDAPSVFARLLDVSAGHWSLHPTGGARAERSYVEGTLVLRTVFETDEGSVSVSDALALEPGVRGHQLGLRSPQVLLRVVEGLAGTVAMRTEFAPRPEYARITPRLQARDGAIIAAAGPTTLRLVTEVALVCEEHTATGSFSVEEGQIYEFSLAAAPSYGGEKLVDLQPDTALADTVEAWQSLAELHQNYQGRYREAVQRSALVLQGLTYQPSGAVVAAATTSLPAPMGGESNWDYRYVWLRDFTLTMRALWVAACPDEANRLFSWISRAAGVIGDQPVPIMYGVAGERDLSERALEHVRGFADSTPVRVGNEAWRQPQRDVLGEVLDAAWLFRDQLLPFDDQAQALLVALADQAASNWQQPDAGMWEARDAERHYLTSKVLCWVALDRAVRLAPHLGERANPDRWALARDDVRRAVLEQGWSRAVEAFTGAFGSAELDASVLILPLVGFLPADDERMRSTIDAIERELVTGGLVRRWAADPGGFVICCYWLVECLALSGEMERAEALFERVTGHANDLGLLAEQIDPASGAHLGNFPQAFSHVGLINAAWRLTKTAADSPAYEGTSPKGNTDYRTP